MHCTLTLVLAFYPYVNITGHIEHAHITYIGRSNRIEHWKRSESIFMGHFFVAQTRKILLIHIQSAFARLIESHLLLSRRSKLMSQWWANIDAAHSSLLTHSITNTHADFLGLHSLCVGLICCMHTNVHGEKAVKLISENMMQSCEKCYTS